jgi:hypothetical protein
LGQIEGEINGKQSTLAAMAVGKAAIGRFAGLMAHNHRVKLETSEA